MPDEKQTQRRPRAPIDKLLALLPGMNQEELIAAHYVVMGAMARSKVKPDKRFEQAMLELGETAAGGAE